MTLYEISNEWRDLLDQIDENQGVLTEDIEQRMTALTHATNAKLDNALDVLANLEAMETAQKAQADRMAKRAKATDKASDLLRERIGGAIAATPDRKHESARWRAVLTTGRPAIIPNGNLQDYNLMNFDPKYVRTEIKKSLDLEALGKLSDEELAAVGFERKRKPFLRIS